MNRLTSSLRVPAPLLAGLLLVLSGLAPSPASAKAAPGAKPKPATPPPVTAGQPAAPAAGWLAANEWELAGNYIESCSDRPLCNGLFGAASPDGDCRKVMIFQVTRGRWHNTQLTGLHAAVVIDAPPGRAIGPETRGEWPRCELWLPESVDSMQAEGLSKTLGQMILGPGGRDWTRVEAMPFVMGLNKERALADAPGRLKMFLRPAASISPNAPPNLSNAGHVFRFLGPLYVYDADTLFCAPKDVPATAAAHRSGLTANFSWTSQVAYQGVDDSETRAAAKKP